MLKLDDDKIYDGQDSKVHLSQFVLIRESEDENYLVFTTAPNGLRTGNTCLRFETDEHAYSFACYFVLEIMKIELWLATTLLTFCPCLGDIIQQVALPRFEDTPLIQGGRTLADIGLPKHAVEIEERPELSESLDISDWDRRVKLGKALIFNVADKDPDNLEEGYKNAFAMLERACLVALFESGGVVKDLSWSHLMSSARNLKHMASLYGYQPQRSTPLNIFKRGQTNTVMGTINTWENVGTAVLAKACKVIGRIPLKGNFPDVSVPLIEQFQKHPHISEGLGNLEMASSFVVGFLTAYVTDPYLFPNFFSQLEINHNEVRRKQDAIKAAQAKNVKFDKDRFPSTPTFLETIYTEFEFVRNHKNFDSVFQNLPVDLNFVARVRAERKEALSKEEIDAVNKVEQTKRTIMIDLLSPVVHGFILACQMVKEALPNWSTPNVDAGFSSTAKTKIKEYSSEYFFSNLFDEAEFVKIVKLGLENGRFTKPIMMKTLKNSVEKMERRENTPTQIEGQQESTSVKKTYVPIFGLRGRGPRLSELCEELTARQGEFSDIILRWQMITEAALSFQQVVRNTMLAYAASQPDPRKVLNELSAARAKSEIEKTQKLRNRLSELMGSLESMAVKMPAHDGDYPVGMRTKMGKKKSP